MFAESNVTEKKCFAEKGCSLNEDIHDRPDRARGVFGFDPVPADIRR
jgi:hypothetical protein